MAEQQEWRKELGKKKILSILPNNLELQGDIYNVKLFSCDKEGKNWLYSDVEGFLGFLIDYQLKTKYLVIYDETTYEKLFQYELYNNFNKSYEELSPDFRCFEIDSGFMGLQFDLKEDAVEFDQILKRVAGLSNDLFAKQRPKDDDAKLKNEKANLFCKALKENFGSDEKYDENYAEDGTTILKHRNFKILSNITYDNDTKQFKFGKISEELKQMFLEFGIKKKELERDADYAFTLFKKIIVGLGNENKLKNSALDSIEHVFPPPEEREKLRKQEEAAEAKMNSIRNKKQNIKRKEKRQTKPATHNTAATQKKVTPQKNTQTAPVASSSAPVPPPPPPMVPGSTFVPPPKVEKVEKVEESIPVVQEEPVENEMAKQLAGVKLKKVVVQENNTANDKMIQGSSKNFLQNALSTAIRNRRNNLHMHDEEEDDDDEDDWD